MAVAVTSSGPVGSDIIARFERLPDLVAADSELVRRGRFFDGDFELGVGATPLAVSVRQGRVTSIEKGPFLLRPWLFAIRAAPEVWMRFLEPVPPPGYHDLMALSKSGLARIEGNLQPFMANLQYVKDVLATARRHGDAGGRR